MLAPRSDLNLEFRTAMRRLAATVSVVSTFCGERRYGITVTSVTSLSIDPSSLVVCINRNTSVHGPIVSSQRFCISMLRENQSAVARTFSGGHNGAERFTSGDWLDGPMCVPYLRDAQANIFCCVEGSMPYASHTVFIGRVIDVRFREQIRPLLYCDGAYTALPAPARSGEQT
jgi:flavin reductase